MNQAISTDQDLLYQVALGITPLVGSKLSKTLLAYCGSAEAVFHTPKSKLQKIPGIGEQISAALTDETILKKAEDHIMTADKNGDRIIFFNNPEYPHKLRQIHNAPTVIFVSGNVDLQTQKALSIVGTRNITSYGKTVTRQIIEGLAPIRDLMIVSGLAYGVDIFAHRLCLEHNIPTLGVMAGGLDCIYPSIHKKTAHLMKEQGGLLTEEPYGTKPVAIKFPARNRIVAGLSDASIIVESARTGGSLITANLAFDYDKEVFAVPGSLDKKYSEGCNKLIADHKAHIFISVEQLLEEMHWDLQGKRPGSTPASPDFSDREPEEQAVLKLLLKDGEQAIDDLTWKLQISPNQLASILLNLELMNFIEVLPGKKYKLIA